MVRCDMHGMQFGVIVCQAVAHSVRHGAAAPIHLVLDGWRTAHVVCDQCQAEIHSHAESVVSGSAGFHGATSHTFELHCGQDVFEWGDHVGHGNLGERIAQLIDPRRRTAPGAGR